MKILQNHELKQSSFHENYTHQLETEEYSTNVTSIYSLKHQMRYEVF